MNPFDAQITFCHATDLERTSAFYEGALGLDLVLDQGACRIFRAASGAYLGFCEHLPPTAGEVILTLVTDEVEGWHRRLVDRGVEVEGPPVSNTKFGIVHFFLRDPDGHRVEIQRFEDAGWASRGR